MSEPTSQQQADLGFLALTVWREARGETLLAKLWVGYSIMGRVRDPSWWGSDVMGVLFKKWQYSSLTSPHDPQLTAWPQSSDPSWKESLEQAAVALAGAHPGASVDSYYDISINPPAWATPDRFVLEVGKLRFYKVQRDYEHEHIASVIPAKLG